jgi:hypothetical protein
VRGWLDAHATLTASTAPRSVDDCELWGMAVNRRPDARVAMSPGALRTLSCPWACRGSAQSCLG